VTMLKCADLEFFYTYLHKMSEHGGESNNEERFRTFEMMQILSNSTEKNLDKITIITVTTVQNPNNF
jgi:hypothetical protein